MRGWWHRLGAWMERYAAEFTANEEGDELGGYGAI